MFARANKWIFDTQYNAMSLQCNTAAAAAGIESPRSSIAGLVPFDDWLKALGKDRSTGYRYRKRGDVTTVNIYGRLYITPEEIRRYVARAAAGEFARKVRSTFAAERDPPPGLAITDL